MGYLDGFAVTFRKVFKGAGDGETLTKNYIKDEGGKREKPVRLHGRHVLNRYEDGMEKCIGCELCAGVCPAKCIYVRGADNPADEPVSPGERYGYVYEINYLRCIHCDLCVEACPTEAITESKLFEFSFTNRADAIYTKDELVVGDDGRPQQLPWEDWSDIDDVEDNTSAWMRATAPGGAAEFEGIVAWAGELGYGVASRSRPDGRRIMSVVNVAECTRPRPRRPAECGLRGRGTQIMSVELLVFLIAGAICIAGALGVVLNHNPVHSALSLVATLFGVAVLFVAQEVHFLAAVQVIVYAGAIVVLFLFVIMLLGVDRTERLDEEPIVGQRILAGVLGVAILAFPLVAILSTTDTDGNVAATGQTGVLGTPTAAQDFNVAEIGEVLFTDYLFAFEITSVLLVIAVVGAVMLAKRVKGEPLAIDADEISDDDPEPTDEQDDDTGADEATEEVSA